MLMQQTGKRFQKEKKICRPALAVLYLLILIITAAVLLTACGHGKENQSVWPHSHSTQQNKDTDKGNIRPEKGSDHSSDTESVNDLSASENGSGTGSEVQTNTGSAGNKAVKDEYKVGDCLQDGDLRITYMASGDYHEESEYRQPEQGHKYIFLEYAFENTSDKKECPVSLFAFRCFADGFAAPAYYGGEKELPASLSAGRYAVGNLYFSVPEEAGKIEVEYQPDDPAAGKVRFSYDGEKDSGYKPQGDSRRTKGAFREGDTAVSDLQRIVYLSCKADDSDNENVHPAEGCTYWTLTFEFENLQDEERQVSVHDFSCYADGRSCSRTLFRDDYLSADVPGGRKAKGTVTFEVPDDAHTAEVEYDTGRRSDAPVVFTLR